MCGIAGLFDLAWKGGHDGLLRTGRLMADAIAHRGPDAEGVEADPEAGLVFAHRRLSIVDLSASGSQPMASADGRYLLCYNGEVYNFEEMRRHPALGGINWRGHSDTEVILESIGQRGLDDTLADMNGMFALALWDRKEKRMHLVRDRLGIKPLFFWRQGTRVVFGSELKALVAAGMEREIDQSAVAAFLRYGYVPAAHGIFRGLRKVLPGEVISFGMNSEVERRTYWSLESIAQGERPRTGAATDEVAEERLHALLSEAISGQMMSDVPLGAFLSGGIDSSVVTALMVAAGKGPVRTFSIGFPDFGFDESVYAADVARHLGTDHTELTVSAEEALETVPRLAYMYDEPFADSSQIPTFLLSRLTREHVTVALSGDGGDELFAGYNRYAFVAGTWKAVQRLPAPLRQLAARAMSCPPPSLFDRLAQVVPGRFLPNQLGDKIAKAASILPLDQEAVYRRLISQIPDPALHIGSDEATSEMPVPPHELDLIDRMRFRDTLTYLPDDILQKVDRASMAVALEARPPLLDHRVVEFAWQLPRDQLIRGGQTKYLLRRVLRRYVPDALIERPKMGFGVPLATWLRGPLRQWAENLILVSDYGGGLLRPEPARRLWSEHVDGGRNHAYQLWTLLMFEAWRRRWT